mgnify:FL=1
MVDVNEVTGFVSVKAYGGVGFVTAVVKPRIFVLSCLGLFGSFNQGRYSRLSLMLWTLAIGFNP